MKKLLLIDGHSILNRAFYGVPDLTNDKGLHTNAVYGFLNIMFKIIDEEKPTHLVVAFDVSAPTFRHEIYKEYKGTRHPAPEEFRQQVPMMKDVLCAMGITIKEKAGLEADDILGTHAKRAEKDGFEVTLLSGDRDLLQIASDNIKIRIPKTSKGKTEVFDYYAKDVEKEYHVTPLKFIELKALMGDTSDNIPGIAGVGPKTAMGLMEQFGSIEGIYSHIDDIKSASLREKVRNGKDSVDLSKILATINIDADIETDWDKCLMGNMFGPEAYDKYVELGLRKLLSKFDDVSKETCNTAESIDDITTRITHMTDAGEYESFIDKCCNKEGMTAVKLMYEKKGGRFEENSGQLSLFEVSDTSVRILAGIYDGDDIYYIDSKFVGEDVLTQGLKRLYQSGNMVVTHDVKDYYLLAGINDEYADGIDKKIRDVSLAAYLINPLKSNPPMEYIASEYAGLFIPDIELPAKKESLSEAASNRRRECMNKLGLYAYGIYNSYSGLMKLLDEYKMTHLYEKMEMPVSYVLYSMERRGVLVKKEELTAFGDSLAESTEKLEESIYKQAGEKFNINSPKQLGELLFGKMGLEGGKKTKTGYSTGAEVLEKLAPTCPMVKDILEYRTLTKLKSTFVDSLGDYIGDDGRIHSNFNQTITATGRISSTEPNLQNIPTRTDLGRQIRKMFVAGEGNVLCDADYSQVELRILASFAGDKELIDAYKNNKDIHALTASLVFKVPFDEVTDQMRRNAKAVNFGIVYGISSFGLSQDLSIEKKEAAAYIEDYFVTYPGIKAYLDEAKNSAKEKGYSETFLHRRRPIPELASSNFMQRQFGERVAMNAPIQGSAADVMKMAMIHVFDRLKKEKMQAALILQIHDELIIEAPENEREKALEILSEEMTGAADLAVKLEVSSSCGHSWYDAK